MTHKMSWIMQVLVTAYLVYSAVTGGIANDWRQLALSLLGVLVAIIFFAYLRIIEDMI